jgi:tetratricopeptide (TPR) repeat protein
MPTRALVVLLLVSRVALADDGRLAAEQLAKKAASTNDPAAFVACGQAYLDVYNQDPSRSDGDEVLYNSGVCFREAHSVASAILAWEQLLKSFPGSKLGGKGVMQVAMAYLGIARFDEAAARFEDYAKRYAGEKDARDTLANAIMLRTALGDRDKRIADTRLFVLTYGARAPAEAANAMLALVSAYDAPADQAKALREYIKTYGNKGSHEQLAEAYQRLGDALWRQSCPVRPVDGLCAKLVVDKTKHCGTSTTRLQVVARTPLRKDALAAYDQASKLVAEAGLTDPAARHAAAMAMLARADDLLETMAAQRFPSPVTTKAFATWFAAETKAGEDASRAYEQVLATKDAGASVAAAARLGQLSQQFSAALTGGEIPADVRSGTHAAEATQAYCDQMGVAAEPLHERAQTAFGVCTEKAVELGVFDEWTALCRRETKTEVAEVQPELTLAIPLAGDGSPGEKAWRAGRREEAMQAWQDALHADGKLYAPRIDLAIAELEKLHEMAATDPARRPLASDVEYQASSALAVRGDALAHVVLAMLALETKHIDLARALVDQALREDDKSPLLYSAHAVVEARRGEWTRAYASAERAVDVDAKSEIALRTAGLVAAHVGVFDKAKERLAKVNEQTYEVVLARAIAARGLGDQKTAETLYQQALKLGPGRSEAQRDLDLLHAPSVGR